MIKKKKRSYPPVISCDIRLNNRIWELLMAPDLLGWCQKQNKPKRMIGIVDKRRDVRGLDTLVHELLHAICPDKGEPWVRQRAHELASILWKCGLCFKDTR